MNEDRLAEFVKRRLDEDEQWALAASTPYRYADAVATIPPEGVHWQWVTGKDWEPVTPDPVISEFLADPGHSCNLVTVEGWPVTLRLTEAENYTRMQRKPVADGVIEMDAASAGHIVRHDPARVLREVEAKRRVLIAYDNACSAVASWSEYTPRRNKIQDETAMEFLREVLREFASAWSDHPDYMPEWALGDSQ